MVRGLATKPAKVGSDKIYLTKAREFLKGAMMQAGKEGWKLISSPLYSCCHQRMRCGLCQISAIAPWWSGSYASSRASEQPSSGKI